MTHRHRIRAAGFTLVEVMLTTVLAAVLLFALWSLLSMYSKTFEGGQARTEQSQLGRALLEQFSTDLQNVLVTPVLPPHPVRTVPPHGPSPDSGTVGSLPNPSGGLAATSAPPSSPPFGAQTGAVFSAPPANPELAIGLHDVSTSSLRPAGLFGTSTFLQIDVVQPAMLVSAHQPDEFVVDSSEASPRAEELRTVVYSFEEYRDPANPSTEPGARLIRQELTWAQVHSARYQAARAATARGDEFPPSDVDAEPFDAFNSASSAEISSAQAIDGEAFVSPSTTIVPEVIEFALRYFNGTAWSEQWDSVAQHGLPAAIEISLRLRSFDETDGPVVNDVTKKPGVDQTKIAEWRYPLQRLLIPLPLAAQKPGVNKGQSILPPEDTANLVGAGANGNLDE